MFQFLIGRMKTQEGDYVWVQLQEFQFLIGRMKTDENGMLFEKYGKGFNSS